MPFLIYARYQHVPAQTKIQRHTECAYYFGFLVRQYSYLDAIHYNTLIKSQHPTFPPHRGSKGVGTPRVPFLIYARYQPVSAQTKIQRHTECAYYFGFLVRQYSYLDAIGYNTLIKSELSDFFPPSRLQRCRHTPYAVLDICPIPARSRPDQSSRHTECGYYFGFLVRQYSYLDAIHYNT